MYLQKAIAMFAVALKSTFDGDYIDERFRHINVGIDFPMDAQDYPAIWCDFEPAGDLTTVGIGHVETDVAPSGLGAHFQRWRFQGYVTYTAIALSKAERDGLYDEIIRVLAFGKESAITRPFRATIEDNPLLAINMNFDKIAQRGFAESPGTPWGTDEIMYEATLAIEVIGEFVADPVTATLVPISRIDFIPIRQDQADPSPGW